MARQGLVWAPRRAADVRGARATHALTREALAGMLCTGHGATGQQHTSLLCTATAAVAWGTALASTLASTLALGSALPAGKVQVLTSRAEW